MKAVLLCAVVTIVSVYGGYNVLPEFEAKEIEKMKDNLILVNRLLKENGDSLNDVEQLLHLGDDYNGIIGQIGGKTKLNLII